MRSKELFSELDHLFLLAIDEKVVECLTETAGEGGIFLLHALQDRLPGATPTALDAEVVIGQFVVDVRARSQQILARARCSNVVDELRDVLATVLDVGFFERGRSDPQDFFGHSLELLAQGSRRRRFVTFSYHFRERGAAELRVDVLEEVTKGIGVVDEGLHRPTHVLERFSVGGLNFREDHDEIEIGMGRRFAATDGSADENAVGTLVAGFDKVLRHEQRRMGRTFHLLWL